MTTQIEAIIEAFEELGGVRTVEEIRNHVLQKYGFRWKDFGTAMADMVRPDLGGNLSSLVPGRFRLLARSSRGRYYLTVENISRDPMQIEHNQDLDEIRFPTEMANEPDCNNFLVLLGHNMVEAWSEKRLSFEPVGWSKLFRDEVRKSLSSIKSHENEVFHAVYISDVSETCDVENVLLYNVGASFFPKPSCPDVRFERLFFPAPQLPLGCEGNDNLKHYSFYEFTDNKLAWDYWETDEILAAWEAHVSVNDLLEVISSQNPAPIWYSIKKGDVELGTKVNNPPPQFSLRIWLHVPRHVCQVIENNLFVLVKPLFDGIASGLHQHDGSEQIEISNRLSLSLKSPAWEVAQLLNDGTANVLGKIPLVRLRKTGGVQWMPNDNRCVAGELGVGSSDKDFVSITGVLCSVIEGSNSPIMRACADESSVNQACGRCTNSTLEKRRLTREDMKVCKAVKKFFEQIEVYLWIRITNVTDQGIEGWIDWTQTYLPSFPLFGERVFVRYEEIEDVA